MHYKITINQILFAFRITSLTQRFLHFPLYQMGSKSTFMEFWTGQNSYVSECSSWTNYMSTIEFCIVSKVAMHDTCPLCRGYVKFKGRTSRLQR